MTACEYAPCNEDCALWEKCQNRKLRKKREPTGLNTSDLRTYKREYARMRRAAEKET